MCRMNPHRWLPQSLRLLIFICFISSAANVAANYTHDVPFQAQSSSTLISSPWPSTRVRNIKGAVPSKTESTRDFTSRFLVYITDGDYDAAADSLKEIGEKAGSGDFRSSKRFKADELRTLDYTGLTNFQAGQKSDLLNFIERKNYPQLSMTNQLNGTKIFLKMGENRKKRNNYIFRLINAWPYQSYRYAYYGLTIPTVLFQFPMVTIQFTRLCDTVSQECQSQPGANNNGTNENIEETVASEDLHKSDDTDSTQDKSILVDKYPITGVSSVQSPFDNRDFTFNDKIDDFVLNKTNDFKDTFSNNYDIKYTGNSENGPKHEDKDNNFKDNHQNLKGEDNSSKDNVNYQNEDNGFKYEAPSNLYKDHFKDKDNVPNQKNHDNSLKNEDPNNLYNNYFKNEDKNLKDKNSNNAPEYSHSDAHEDAHSHLPEAGMYHYIKK